MRLSLCVSPAHALAKFCISSYVVSKKMIPKELSVLLDGLEVEDNGGVMLKSVDSDDQTLLLSLCIRTGQEDEPDQPWTIRCRGVRKESICFEWPTPYWKKRSTRFYGRT